MSVAGVAIGLAGTFAMSRIIQSQLYGVTATDPCLGAIALALVLAAAGIEQW